MVEAVWNDSSVKLLLPPAPAVQQQTLQTTVQQPTPQYLQINYGNTGTGSTSRRESLLSPSAGRRAKQQKNIASKYRCAFCSFLANLNLCFVSMPIMDETSNSLNSTMVVHR